MSANGFMREYETIYIMRPDLDDKAAKDQMLAKKKLIESFGGKNIKVTAMGRKRLSWVSQKESRGIFVHHQFLGAPGIVDKFDRALSIDDKILVRHSVLLKDHVNPELVKVEEDSLTPPAQKERREYSDRRGRFDRGDDFDRKPSGSDHGGFRDDD